MRRLGERRNIYGTDNLVRQEWPNRPENEYPTDLPDGQYVVCGFGQGKTEELAIAHTFRDMITLYDEYWMGATDRINWYIIKGEMTIFDDE